MTGQVVGMVRQRPRLFCLMVLQGLGMICCHAGQVIIHCRRQRFVRLLPGGLHLRGIVAVLGKLQTQRRMCFLLRGFQISGHHLYILGEFVNLVCHVRHDRLEIDCMTGAKLCQLFLQLVVNTLQALVKHCSMLFVPLVVHRLQLAQIVAMIGQVVSMIRQGLSLLSLVVGESLRMLFCHVAEVLIHRLTQCVVRLLPSSLHLCSIVPVLRKLQAQS
mmetsp:Transcript_112353/g.206241  ORF Transcript_112353/g.206241 Transcript_112353/m.206241 type:complete len:217 (+) Transcript_112353:129-779(+)